VTEDEIIEATEHVQRAMMGDREASKRVVNLYAPQMLDYIRQLQRRLKGETEPAPAPWTV